MAAVLVELLLKARLYRYSPTQNPKACLLEWALKEQVWSNIKKGKLGIRKQIVLKNLFYFLGLFELSKTNTEFYGRPVKAAEILQGEITPPQECQVLYDVIKQAEERDPY